MTTPAPSSKSRSNPVILRLRTLKARLRLAFRGVLAAVVLAIAATFLSEHYGGPVMLFALLLGMAFRFLSEDGPCVAGIDFASTTVLRLGVALLGMRITIAQIADLGLGPIAIVVGTVLATMAFGLLASKLMGRGVRFGTLTGGAVAICGASAALALAAVLPRTERSERDTIFTVIAVTTLSTIAMILYPIVVARFGLDDQAAGIFLGGTIHDVAQVVGAGYSVSETTGDTATFIKLLRVAMLLPIVFVLGLAFRKAGCETGNCPLPLPGFIIGFAVLVGVNSAGIMPEAARLFLVDTSRWCLVTAIAALGMKTSLKALSEVGLQPVTLIVAETIFLAVLVLVLLAYL